MSNSFSSRRITISYFAAEEICKLFGLPLDVTSQALGSAVEKLIFQNGKEASTPIVVQQNPPTGQLNKSALAAMAQTYQGKKEAA
ncbi:MAG: hypothetical protein KME31_23895 [Tolypothrix carrinoi HA7290-LM1]|jgi:hypothetical protein|nr:hypothetical protein [Tolypothrix carrinoi HA7290-LM1]